MFHVIATDKVWVEGFAHVSDVYRVKDGQAVKVTLTLLEPSRTPPITTDEKKPSFSPGLQSSSLNTPPAAELPRETQIELPVANSFDGRIVYIDLDVNFSARVFRVRAEVDNKYDLETKLPILRAGMNANMTIVVQPPPANGGPKN
jgi:hypothetical protein